MRPEVLRRQGKNGARESSSSVASAPTRASRGMPGSGGWPACSSAGDSPHQQSHAFFGRCNGATAVRPRMRNGRETRQAVSFKGGQPGGADTDQLALGLASTDVDDLAPLQDAGVRLLDGAPSLDVQSPDAAAATAPTRTEEILAGLTDEQRDAVTHAGGPLLI